MFGRADFIGTGDIYTDAKNNSKLKAYNTVNLNLGFMGDSFDISLWAKNIFDKEYYSGKCSFSNPDRTYVAYGPPRTIGLRINYRI